MVARVKTRERIVQQSLKLFNQQGERNVSTNHIAASMEMSPGNLYYHFANKQAIVAILFDRYEAQVYGFLQRPAGRLPNLADKRTYLHAVMSVMWDYRFLYRDLEHLLESDAVLAVRYRVFSKQCLAQGRLIYAGFVEAGILSMNNSQIEALTLNVWVILTSWVRHLCTTLDQPAILSEQVIKRGVYQILMLQSGHVCPQWREAMAGVCEEFHVPTDDAPVGRN